MSKINNGGQAFPQGPKTSVIEQSNNVSTITHSNHIEGMTLRDYFATAAMQGWLSTNAGQAEHCGLDKVELFYTIADRMLKERKK